MSCPRIASAGGPHHLSLRIYACSCYILTRPSGPCLILVYHDITRARAKLLIIDAWLEDADVGEVAILLGVVEAVSDDEAIGQLKAEILRLDHFLAHLRFIQYRAGFEAGG